MPEYELRSMRPSDWAEATIERDQYSNKECALTGYQRVDGQAGNLLHPACVFEDRLRETHDKFRDAYPDVIVARYHVKMPYWDRRDRHLPYNYSFVAAPERLTTTSVTVVMVPNRSQSASMGFYFRGSELPSLRERLEQETRAGMHFEGLAGNLGYFMTEKLIRGNLRWSHNSRYPEEFHLPVMKSYIGFHLFRDGRGEIYGSFQGAHPAAVGVLKSGRVEIVPRLMIEGYKVRLAGRELDIDAINTVETRGKDVVLFTPELWTPEVAGHVDDWDTYAPTVPAECLPTADIRADWRPSAANRHDADDDRVNVFIANEGNGVVPIERVVRVWRGPAPLPSFGAVLSFDTRAFEKAFVNVDVFSRLGDRLRIIPYGDTDFDSCGQIMGGFVPAVVDGQHIYCVNTVDDVMENLRCHGNATSPIAQAGRETENFDPRIREPAGVLAQTRDRIGWVLFDGRHELSIGASVVDVAVLLKELQGRGAFGGEIENAVFIDGGSAMKAYAVKSNDAGITLDLLNRVAAGGRNGPGDDPDGLNLYTLLRLPLCADRSAPTRGWCCG